MFCQIKSLFPEIPQSLFMSCFESLFPTFFVPSLIHCPLLNILNTPILCFCMNNNSSLFLCRVSTCNWFILSMTSAQRKTVFNLEWMNTKLNPDFASWIQVVNSSPNDAFCRLCRTKFSLSNMGRKAVSSHMNGAKHMKNYGYTTRNASHGPLASFFVPCMAAAAPSEVGHDSVVPVDEKTVNSDEVGELATTSATHVHDIIIVNTQTVNVEKTMAKPALQSFVTNDQVTKAEVLWIMKCLMSHYSCNSSRDMKEIFALMFPDSAIAKKITIGSTKIAYVVTHGLAPYFHGILTKTLNSCSEYVVCFDEALNEISQKGQMDIVIRYWDTRANLVSSRYFCSAFMGHATANDILETFQVAMAELNIGKVVQVSMDGPAVNWKFLQSLDTFLSQDGKATVLLDLGSCGLHVVHGALQTGHKVSTWNVNAWLRAMYSLFKDSPARRADYIAITGSMKFPKKFCQVRWVENVGVAARALEVIDGVKKYVQQTKNLPKTTTCTNVKELCSDPLAVPKIAFFASVAALLEPFLKRFQTAAPMACFLYDDIANVLRSVLLRFVKRAVIDLAKSTNDLMKIDVGSKDVRCTYKEVDLGVATQKALLHCKLGDLEKMKFRMQCIDFLAATAAKVIERSPLKYAVVRAISCFVPSRISNNRTLSEKRMAELAQILYERNHFTAVVCDSAKVQFSALCGKAVGDLKGTFEDYSAQDMRLDTFYFDIVGKKRVCRSMVSSQTCFCSFAWECECRKWVLC
jgi:hypothetical protein